MIKFGPSGNSKSFYAEGHKSTTETPKWLSERGLDCFEYSLGRGITMGMEKAIAIGNAAKEQGIELSVHAPYYINFCDEAGHDKSFDYILKSLEILKGFGGKRLVFHVGSQKKLDRQTAVDTAKQALKKMADTLRSVYPELIAGGVMLCPETMGNSSRVGTIDEIIEFCKIDEMYVPCVDFGHVNAIRGGEILRLEGLASRTTGNAAGDRAADKGEQSTLWAEKPVQAEKKEQTNNFSDARDALTAEVRSAEPLLIGSLEYEKIMDKFLVELGDKARVMHIHFSQIEYSTKGEVRHLTFEDTTFGPFFKDLAPVLRQKNLQPYIVCESDGTQAEDAVRMKKIMTIDN